MTTSYSLKPRVKSLRPSLKSANTPHARYQVTEYQIEKRLLFVFCDVNQRFIWIKAFIAPKSGSNRRGGGSPGSNSTAILALSLSLPWYLPPALSPSRHHIIINIPMSGLIVSGLRRRHRRHCHRHRATDGIRIRENHPRILSTRITEWMAEIALECFHAGVRSHTELQTVSTDFLAHVEWGGWKLVEECLGRQRRHKVSHDKNTTNRDSWQWWGLRASEAEAPRDPESKAFF